MTAVHISLRSLPEALYAVAQEDNTGLVLSMRPCRAKQAVQLIMNELSKAAQAVTPRVKGVQFEHFERTARRGSSACTAAAAAANTDLQRVMTCRLNSLLFRR